MDKRKHKYIIILWYNKHNNMCFILLFVQYSCRLGLKKKLATFLLLLNLAKVYFSVKKLCWDLTKRVQKLLPK